LSDRIRWGILGTGKIAQKFVEGLAAVPDAELVAVGSRARPTAEAFGDTFGVPRRHASYRELAEDRDIDAVYIATPNPLHAQNSILCLEAGKAVLCEKPFAVNARQAEDAITTARHRRVFLMEAMWTRFLPVIAKVRGWISDGTLGEVRMVEVNYGYRTEVDPRGRVFNPALAGGSLLDVGVYGASFASMIFGPHPDEIRSTAHLGKTGVDEQAASVLRYPSGQLALLFSAVRTQTHDEARIYGTDGRIVVHPPFHAATRATLERDDQQETADCPLEGNGFNYQIEEVDRQLREGQTESPVMPLDETLGIVRIMDRIRQQWGLKYPME
jgi:predicted dehydrogenase